jgi:hypothetical protein
VVKARSAPPVTEAERLVLAVLGLLPVVVVILFAGHLTRAIGPAPDSGVGANTEGSALRLRRINSVRVEMDEQFAAIHYLEPPSAMTRSRLGPAAFIASGDHLMQGAVV